MGINIDKFNKWRKETSLDIEVTTLNWNYGDDQKMALTVQGNMEEVTEDGSLEEVFMELIEDV